MQLNFDAQTGLFKLKGHTYAQRDIPKSAGMRWNGDAKEWWTDRPDVAQGLVEYASPEARDAITAMLAAGTTGTTSAPNQFRPNQFRNQFKPNQFRPNQFRPNQFAPAAPAAPRPPVVGTAQQEAFWNAVEHGKSHIVLQARAGCGKTFSIIEAANRLPRARIGFSAFNTSIAKELQEKVPHNAKAFTLHGLGMAAINRHFKDIEVELDDKKVAKIVEKIVPEEHRVPKGGKLAPCPTFAGAVRELVSLCKSHLYDGTDPAQLEELADRHTIDLDPSDEEIARREKTGEDKGKAFNVSDEDWAAELLRRYRDRIFRMVPVVLNLCAAQTDKIDYDDMIWLPVQLDLRTRTYDVLFVDEAQDMNLCQQRLAFKACPAGRIVIVGDEKQSIYAFRGADTRSMERMRELLAETPQGCEVYPLTQTRRCPKKVVALAQGIVPDIEAMPDAPEGSVEHVEQSMVAVRATPDDMVLCRTNAPLVGVAYELLRLGKRPNFKGRDLGKRLRELVEYLMPYDPDEAREADAAEIRLMDAIARGEATEPTEAERKLAEVVRLGLKVQAYSEREVARLKAEDKPLSRIEQVQDQCATVEVLLEGCASLDEYDAKLKAIFEDKPTHDAIPLSSVHGAKGLEARTVFLLHPDEMPHRMAEKAEDIEQEWNIKYVAITRAKEVLVCAYRPESKAFKRIKEDEAEALQQRALAFEHGDVEPAAAAAVPSPVEPAASTGIAVVDAHNALVDSLNDIGTYCREHPEAEERVNAAIRRGRAAREAADAEAKARAQADATTEGEPLTWQQELRAHLCVMEEKAPFDQLEVLALIEQLKAALPR